MSIAGSTDVPIAQEPPTVAAANLEFPYSNLTNLTIARKYSFPPLAKYSFKIR